MKNYTITQREYQLITNSISSLKDRKIKGLNWIKTKSISEVPDDMTAHLIIFNGTLSDSPLEEVEPILKFRDKTPYKEELQDMELILEYIRPLASSIPIKTITPIVEPAQRLPIWIRLIKIALTDTIRELKHSTLDGSYVAKSIQEHKELLTKLN